jgi:hypothetical protein
MTIQLFYPNVTESCAFVLYFSAATRGDKCVALCYREQH